MAADPDEGAGGRGVLSKGARGRHARALASHGGEGLRDITYKNYSERKKLTYIATAIPRVNGDG